MSTDNDFAPFAEEFVFSQQESDRQCALVRLFNDSDSSEGTEQFTVSLTLSSLSENVILTQSSATVSISDSLTSILSDLLKTAESANQTNENLQLIGDVIEDIAGLAISGQTETDTEVRSFLALQTSHAVNVGVLCMYNAFNL